MTAPFVLNRPSQFRPQPPPPLSSVAYERAYDEVKALGALTNSTRTPEQNELALFWETNPGAAWYATVRSIADAHVPDVGDKARLFALVSLAAADALITCWDSKYHFSFWRPITAIREGDNDRQPAHRRRPDVAAHDSSGTPPYPDYTSGQNSVAGSITGILELYFGTDEFEFSILSSAAGPDRESTAVSPLLGSCAGSGRGADPARHSLPVRGRTGAPSEPPRRSLGLHEVPAARAGHVMK